MSIQDVTPNSIPEKGVTYSKIITVGDAAERLLVPNDTYFYDLSDDLPYYKSNLGLITGVFYNINKKPNIFSVTNTSTLTINPLLCDTQLILNQNSGIVMGVPLTTPHQGSKMTIRLKDDGTSRTITWNPIFRGIYDPLPSKTVPGKTLYLDLVYNETDSMYDVVSPKATVDIFSSIEIGSWDLTGASTKSVSHGLSATEWKTVRNMGATIINDADDDYQPLTAFGLISLSSTSFDILIGSSTSNYDDAAVNRGYVSFFYTPD